LRERFSLPVKILDKIKTIASKTGCPAWIITPDR
jgi:hypothetical protein